MFVTSFFKLCKHFCNIFILNVLRRELNKHDFSYFSIILHSTCSPITTHSLFTTRTALHNSYVLFIIINIIPSSFTFHYTTIYSSSLLCSAHCCWVNFICSSTVVFTRKKNYKRTRMLPRSYDTWTWRRVRENEEERWAREWQKIIIIFHIQHRTPLHPHHYPTAPTLWQ